MSQENPVRVFVTHLWAPDDEYLRVFEYLESAQNFFYKNMSNVEAKLRSFDKETQKEELRKQMTDAEIVIVLAAQYARDPVMIEFQAIYAKACDKPILLLEQFGVTLPLPPKLKSLADEVVPWNSRELSDAVRRQARHEETTRWDTIEFKLD